MISGHEHLAVPKKRKRSRVYREAQRQKKNHDGPLSPITLMPPIGVPLHTRTVNEETGSGQRPMSSTAESYNMDRHLSLADRTQTSHTQAADSRFLATPQPYTGYQPNLTKHTCDDPEEEVPEHCRTLSISAPDDSTSFSQSWTTVPLTVVAASVLGPAQRSEDEIKTEVSDRLVESLDQFRSHLEPKGRFMHLAIDWTRRLQLKVSDLDEELLAATISGAFISEATIRVRQSTDGANLQEITRLIGSVSDVESLAQSLPSCAGIIATHSFRQLVREVFQGSVQRFNQSVLKIMRNDPLVHQSPPRRVQEQFVEQAKSANPSQPRPARIQVVSHKPSLSLNVQKRDESNSRVPPRRDKPKTSLESQDNPGQNKNKTVKTNLTTKSQIAPGKDKTKATTQVPQDQPKKKTVKKFEKPQPQTPAKGNIQEVPTSLKPETERERQLRKKALTESKYLKCTSCNKRGTATSGDDLIGCCTDCIRDGSWCIRCINKGFQTKISEFPTMVQSSDGTWQHTTLCSLIID